MAEQEADRDGVGPGLGQLPGHGLNGGAFERTQYAAVEGHPLRRLEAALTRHQRRRMVRLQLSLIHI